METLFTTMLNDLQTINNDLGYPVFEWQGTTYSFGGSPSVTKVSRMLENGGFVFDELLTATISRYTTYGQAVFPNDTIPSPQQTMVYNGLTFRIQSVSLSPVYNHRHGQTTSAYGATFFLTAIHPYKGI